MHSELLNARLTRALDRCIIPLLVVDRWMVPSDMADDTLSSPTPSLVKTRRSAVSVDSAGRRRRAAGGGIGRAVRYGAKIVIRNKL